MVRPKTGAGQVLVREGEQLRLNVRMRTLIGLQNRSRGQRRVGISSEFRQECLESLESVIDIIERPRK